jgi:hypothetical protein
MNELTIVPPARGMALVPQNMDEAIRLARAMAEAKMVPRHLQQDIGSCLMVVEQAMRWGMSPFAVAQCTSNIGGKLMYEGKLIAAAVQSCGAIQGNFDFEYAGEGADRQVTVSARRSGETNPRQLTIKLKDVKTKNEWWDRQPDQQLAYSGIRNWARRYTPAALLGVYSPEEIDRSTGKTIEGEVVIQPPQQTRTEENPHPKQTWSQLLDAIDLALHDATSGEEIQHLLTSPRVKQARAAATGKSAERLERIVADAERRQGELDDTAEAEIPPDPDKTTEPVP